MDGIPVFKPDRFQAVAIGASTGAPGQIETILAALPADLPLPLLIAQHLPPSISQSFAAQLDAASALSVVVAEDGMPVYPGVVYIGPGRQHLRVVRRIGARHVIEVGPEPSELLFKPSADELFRSCAGVWRERLLVVVMTGIGRDGTQGARRVRDEGGIVLTQTQATCAVYGMPRSCVEAGLSDAQLSPERIARAILQLSPEHGGKALAESQSGPGRK